MASQLIVVKLDYDPEGGVWYVSNSTFPGLAGEAETFEMLADRIPGMLKDLVEESGLEQRESEIPVEIIASLSKLVTMREPA